MEAATGVTRLQAKERQGFLTTAEAGKRPGTDAPSDPPEGTNPADTLTLDS